MVVEKGKGEAAGMAGVSFGVAGGAGAEDEAKEKGVDVEIDVPKPERPANLLGGVGYGVGVGRIPSQRRRMFGHTSAVAALGAGTPGAFDAIPARLGSPLILLLDLNTSRHYSQRIRTVSRRAWTRLPF